MKKLVVGLLLTALFANVSFGQKDETVFNSLGFTGGWLAQTNTFALLGDGQGVLVGLNGVLEFNKRFLVGWGGGSLISEPKLDDATNTIYDMTYGGAVVGYAFNAHKVLHPKIELLAGSGKLINESEEEDQLLIIQPSVGLELNLFRWFRVNLNAGYRLAGDVQIDNITNKDLSKPFGEIQLKFGWSAEKPVNLFY